MYVSAAVDSGKATLFSKLDTNREEIWRLCSRESKCPAKWFSLELTVLEDVLPFEIITSGWAIGASSALAISQLSGLSTYTLFV